MLWVALLGFGKHESDASHCTKDEASYVNNVCFKHLPYTYSVEKLWLR